MNYKQLLGNFSIAVLAQGTYAIASALLTLVLPKMLGVEAFGYWQLFIFYAGYVGLFHLGLNDGVYLEYGGQRRSEIDKRDINSQFVFSFIIQLAVSAILMAAVSFMPIEANRSFVLFMAAALISVNNAGLYLGYIFQAMNETKLFSASVAIESVVLLFGVIVLMLLGEHRFEPYVILYFLTKVIRLVYCCCYSKDFLKAGLNPLNAMAKHCINYVSIGIKLMIANLAGSLVLGIARFLIDGCWGVEVFSEVSLALSITSFFMTFISQASMVLFPALRQSSDSDMASFYCITRDALNFLLPIIYLLYYPVVLLLGLWLPDYAASLIYFSYVLPICLFDGKMDILGTTYLKVLRREDDLLKINVITMFVSIVVSFIGAYYLRSLEFILFSVVLALGVRELLVEGYISKLLDSTASSMSVAVIVLSGCFVIASNLLSPFAALAVYLLALLLYLTKFRYAVIAILSKLKKR